MKSYQYDVFLSFTGADREVKNQIRLYLKNALDLECYDSDLYCQGQFRPDFCQALDKSRVYLMILSDNLRKIPTEGSAQTLTEVRRECSLACELEARNELNIVILCMSEFFRFDRAFHDHSDQLGWFFYSSTRGYSQIRGEVEESGMLAERTLESVGSQCRTFVERRNAGTPIISQAPKYDVATEALVDRGLFVGRENLLKDAEDAFTEGRQAVVLSGMGGIGKTTLAAEIARRCEEQKTLRCLQVVYINEVAKGERNGGAAEREKNRDALRTVVSSVTYTKEVYDSLPMLAERDRYERKLAALRALPEYVLLVIDNLNDLTEHDVAELVSKLKCRLLITTRAAIEDSIEGVAVLSVDSLNADDAYEMFCRISGMKDGRDRFNGLYRSVGGHTITLCIMARLMATHRLSLEELIEQMGEPESFDARVDFRHNEYGDSNTVLGHLEKLFDISDFGEGGRHILRSMSLLANGTVAVRDLMEMLSLRNRNEILELTRSGWLELQVREEGDEVREYLYLHPILSRLMAKQLVPTEENTGEMIAYLARRCDDVRSNMTYADATVLEDGLYYACFVLAGGSRRLSGELWTRFVEVNHLLGNVGETAKKTELLAARVANAEERSVISSYVDMITLEQFPTRVEILDKYLGTLKDNARDYKWVMRSLSVTLPHIRGVEKFRPFLLQALERAIDAAIAQEDDFSLLDLFAYYMVVTQNMSSLFRRLRAYIRAQRKKGRESGAMIYLDLLLSGSTALAAKNASDYISKTLANIQALMNDDFSTSIKMLLLHPVTVIRMSGWDKRLKRLDPADPLFLPLSVISGEVDRFSTDGQFDASALIEATVHMYQMRMERQMTLTSASDAVRGILGMLHAFPEDIVRKGTGELVDRVDMNNISVQSLSNLQVAMLINREFNNREAVTQAKQVIEVLRHLYPEGHSNILSATFSYGEVCEAFGDTENAMRAYAEVYRATRTNNPDSAELVRIADKMLRLPEASQFPLDALGTLYETALTDVEPLSSNAIYRTQNYLYRLFDKAKRGEIGYDDRAFETVWSYFAAVCEEKKRLLHFTAISFMRDVVCGASIYLTNQQQFELSLSMQRFLKPFCKSRKKELRTYAQIYISHIEFYVAFHKKDDSLIALGESIISTCVRKKILQRIASTDAMLLISHLCNHRRMPQDTLIKNDEERALIDSYVRYFGSCCISYKGIDPDAEGSQARMEEAMREVFCEKLRVLSGELYLKDMNIPAKAYAKLRTADAFMERVFTNLMQTLIESYRERPIGVTFREKTPPTPMPKFIPPSERKLPRPRQVRLPYENCRASYSCKWQPDQVEELKEWLLASICRFFANRPEDMEGPPDDPTGEWTDLARDTWKELSRDFCKEDEKAIPALIFAQDAELTDKIRRILPTVGLAEDRAEEIAQFLYTCGGLFPSHSATDADNAILDPRDLDSIAEGQGYPRELFMLAAYVRCIRNETMQKLNVNTLSEAMSLIDVGTDRSLLKLGYSGVNRFHPLDRYLVVSYFVNTRL